MIWRQSSCHDTVPSIGGGKSYVIIQMISPFSKCSSKQYHTLDRILRQESIPNIAIWTYRIIGPLLLIRNTLWLEVKDWSGKKKMLWYRLSLTYILRFTLAGNQTNILNFPMITTLFYLANLRIMSQLSKSSPVRMLVYVSNTSVLILTKSKVCIPQGKSDCSIKLHWYII